MEASIIRRLYCLLPFMFLFQILAFGSLCWFAGSSGGLDLSTNGSDFPGLSETCILLPLAFILTVISLIVFPRLKSEEPALLLFLVEIILNVVLAVQACRIWLVFFGWWS